MSRTEGRPIVRRFVIRRHPVAYNYEYSWSMRDRSRPNWLGNYRTLAEAIEAMVTRLRKERGLPPRIKW